MPPMEVVPVLEQTANPPNDWWAWVLNTGLGIVLGGLLTVAIAVLFEYWKKPQLAFSIEPPLDLEWNLRPAKKGRFLRVRVENHVPWRIISWFIQRSPAIACRCQLMVFKSDGHQLFDKPRVGRWSGTPEPQQFHVNDLTLTLPVYDAIDILPGEHQLIDIACRLDDDPDCYLHSNENYVPGSMWRNPQLMIPQGNFLVRITVTYHGNSSEDVVYLANERGDHHRFLLHDAKLEDKRKIMG